MSGVVSNWGVDYLEIDPDYIQVNAEQPVAVFVLDTVDETEHPGLAGVVEPKWSANFTDSPSGAKQHHGTHVAGIIAAAPAPGPEGGPIGVARALYDAGMLRVGLVKVLNDQGAGAWSWIINGINHVRDIAAQEPGIRFVINMSLGGSTPNPAMQDAIMKANTEGIEVICAAGNSGNSGVDYPGKYLETWAVGAVDMQGRAASFSGRGPEVTVAAPGVQITSTYYGNTYAALGGTSMAAPHMAGIAAILLSLYPDLDPDELMQYVLAWITDLDTPGHDHATGYGVPKLGRYRANPYTEDLPDPPPPPEEPEPPKGSCLERVLPFLKMLK